MKKVFLFSFIALVAFVFFFFFAKEKQEQVLDNVFSGAQSPQVSSGLKTALFWNIENPHKQAFFRQLKALRLQSGKEKLIAYYGDEKLKKKKFDHLKLIPLSFEETVAYFQDQGISLTEEQKDNVREKDPFIYEF